MDYGSKEKIGSPKPERPHPPKLFCMHFTTTSTCMNFLSRFYFWPPWTEGKIWLFWRQAKKGQNLWNWKGYTHQNWFACISQQPLLAWIFLSPFCFLTLMEYSPWSKREIWRQMKRSKISKTNKVMPPNWYTCISHQTLLPLIFWGNKNTKEVERKRMSV